MHPNETLWCFKIKTPGRNDDKSAFCRCPDHIGSKMLPNPLSSMKLEDESVAGRIDARDLYKQRNRCNSTFQTKTPSRSSSPDLHFYPIEFFSVLPSHWGLRTFRTWRIRGLASNKRQNLVQCIQTRHSDVFKIKTLGRNDGKSAFFRCPDHIGSKMIPNPLSSMKLED